MAARSYLARLAQPLTAADPVVWSTPRAAVDEARPPVEPPSRSLQRAPLAGPASVATGPVSAVKAVGAAPAMAANAAPAATAATRETAPAALHSSNTTAPALHNDVPTAAVAPVELSPDMPASEPGRPRIVPVTIEASAQAGEALIASAEMAAPVSRSKPVATPDQRSATSRSLADRPPPQTSIPLREIGRVPRDPQRPSAPLSTNADPPRLHIGAIEIRISQPPPAPATPVALAIAPATPVPSAPLARSYTSRFGLAQG